MGLIGWERLQFYKVFTNILLQLVLNRKATTSITFERCSRERKPGTVQWCQSAWGRVLLPGAPELQHGRTLCSVRSGTSWDPAPELQSVTTLVQTNTTAW